MTTKWDELVEAAARGGWHRSEWDVEPWEEVPEEIKRHVRAGMDAALRALLAKGYVIVPGEATEEMNDAAWTAVARDVHVQDDPGGAVVIQSVVGHGVWRAMLSAGSIKPEGE